MELDIQTLNAAEAVIWQAAYGASFATRFEDAVAAESFDYAARMMTAEYAVSVANAAVLRFREWHAANEKGLPLAEAKAAVRREMERRGMTPEGS